MESLAVAGASSGDHLSRLVESLPRPLGPDANVILVTTRALEPEDSWRFRAVLNGSSLQTPSSRLRVVSMVAPELAEIYQLE
jgi:hypothetical protein